MDIKKEHFVERLEKDSYSKEEVAGLLHSEAEFRTRTATKGMVGREEFDSVSNELSTAKEALGTYQEKEFNGIVSQEFTKLNGDASRQADLVKLAGLNKDMSSEEVAESIASFKEQGNYEFLFKTTSSGIKTGEHTKEIKKSSYGEFQVPSGADKFLNMFKKKK